MGLFDILKRFGKKTEDHVKINPIVRKDVDPFATWIKEDKLGDGAFGEVYRGRHRDTGRLAAIKQIGVDSDEDLMDYMVEINILTKCKHKNIIDLYEAFLFDSKLWLCIEYCRFGALDSIMIELDKGLAEDQIRMICHEVVEGLQFLHSQGVIHRDVKAGNVLLTADAVVKLADFGVSAMGDSAEVKRNSFIGSQYWMAPEVMACETYNEVPYGTLADIWSLGVTLIELAQMLPPNHNMQPMRMAIRVIKGDPPRLERPKKWSEEFNHFLSRCLVKSPDQRARIPELLAHKFIANIQETDRRVLRNLIAELQAAPEVEVEEVQMRDSEITSGGGRGVSGVGGGSVRDSVFSIADLVNEEDGVGSGMLSSSGAGADAAAAASRLSTVGEDASVASSAAAADTSVTSAAAAAADTAAEEASSTSSSSAAVEPAAAEPAATVQVALEPPTPNAVVPPPEAFATLPTEIAPTSSPAQPQQPPAVAIATSSTDAPATAASQSPRSSVSSETIESDTEHPAQQGDDRDDDEAASSIIEPLATDLRDALLDEVLSDESLEPSVPAVVMQVMQEELNEVSNIDELISSTFDMAVRDHEDRDEDYASEAAEPAAAAAAATVTDIDAVVSSSPTAAAASSAADADAINVEMIESSPNGLDQQLQQQLQSQGSSTSVMSGYGSVTVRSSGGAAAAAAAAAASSVVDATSAGGGDASSSSAGTDAAATSATDDAAAATSQTEPHGEAEGEGEGDAPAKVVRRQKDAKYNSVIIKKKRVFTDETGKQVVTTTIRTVRKGDENKIQDQFINRREQLREQKLLNKTHQKQDTELSLKHELEKQQLEQRFVQELAQLAKEFEAARAHLKREATQAEKLFNQQFEKSLRQETQRAKERQERGLKDLRDTMRRQRRAMDREELKNSQRELKDRDREAERGFLQRVQAEWEEREAAARAQHRRQMDDRHRAVLRELHALERKYRQEREECEERHLFERFEMRMYQHTQHWVLKKQQAMERHERDLERLRKQADARREVLNQSQVLERRRRPKLLKKEQATRTRMFRESLLVTNPGMSDDETRRRLREFDESEKERCQAELTRLETKLARAKDEFERRVARVDAEVRHEQQEMRKLIAEREGDQRRDLEAAKRTQLKEFQEMRRREKEALELRMADEARELEARLTAEADASGLRINGEGRPGGAAAVTQA